MTTFFFTNSNLSKYTDSDLPPQELYQSSLRGVISTAEEPVNQLVQVGDVFLTKSLPVFNLSGACKEEQCPQKGVSDICCGFLLANKLKKVASYSIQHLGGEHTLPALLDNLTESLAYLFNFIFIWWLFHKLVQHHL